MLDVELLWRRWQNGRKVVGFFWGSKGWVVVCLDNKY